MTDKPTIRFGENSPEHIAYKLFMEVARVEKKDLSSVGGNSEPTREWILDTYAECLQTVTMPHARKRSPARA